MKLRKILLTFGTITIFLFIAAIFSCAASEYELNDSFDNANHISQSSTVSGKISTSEDSDYYKITPASNGKISINFLHTYKDDNGSGWNLKTYIYTDGEYKELSSQDIMLNQNENIALPFIGAKGGTTYYIRVGKTYWDGAIGINYNLKVSFTSSNYYEKEINNNYASATGISPNNSYGGIINSNSDVDFYKITPSSNGKISFNFLHTYKDDSGSGWNVKTFIYTDGEYKELSSQDIMLNQNENIVLPIIGAKGGITYYIRVGKTYWDGVIGIDYTFRVSFASSNYYEKEVNNNYASATALSLNNFYSGTINSNSDVDFYQISAPYNSRFSVTFNHDYISDNNNGWYIEYFIYESGEYKKLYDATVSLSSAKSYSLTPLSTKKGYTYYIKISKTYWDDAIGKTYSLSVNINLEAPTSLRVSSRSTTSLSLSWNAVSGAKGYVVYYYNAKNGKYKKLAIVGSNSYTVSNLKAGTIYCFAVKAYKTISKKNYFSEYSNILTTATQPTAPVVSATAGTKSARLSWNKVAGAKGYIIYYSTKQNKGFKTIGSTKKTSVTVSNLVSGKTYYFKVRAFRKAGGVNVFSDYSSVKGAKIK